MKGSPDSNSCRLLRNNPTRCLATTSVVTIAGVTTYLQGLLVGAIGFEPTTPCAQGRCATRLRYAPTVLRFYSIIDDALADSRRSGPRYNCNLMMQTRRYALAAYVRNPVGEFVEKLRRELH